jgi:hypothetical protein
MRGPKPSEIKLTPMLKKILGKVARCYTNPYWLVLRAKIIIYAAAGANNTEIARRLEIASDTAGKWRGRWIEAEPRLSAVEAEGLDENELAALVEAMLADAPRPTHSPRSNSSRSSPWPAKTHANQTGRSPTGRTVNWPRRSSNERS